jgi:predicted DNA binding protein
MSVVADIEIGSEHFALGRAFRDCPEMAVEFERVVPLTGRQPFLVRIADGERDGGAIERAVGAEAHVEDVSEYADADDYGLFEVHLDASSDTVVQAIVAANAHVLAVDVAESKWRFRLQFGDHELLHRFNERLTEAGISVTLRRLHNPRRDEGKVLSTKQREAVRLAHQHGYFAVPRQCTIQELADEVGISDTAFSRRLRRGTGTCIRQVIERG